MPYTPDIWLEQILVNTNTKGNQAGAKTVDIGNGRTLVYWIDDNDDVAPEKGLDIVGMILHPRGFVESGPFTLNTVPIDAAGAMPDIVSVRAGGFLMVYSTSKGHVLLERYDANMVHLESETIFQSTSPDVAGSDPSIAARASGLGDYYLITYEVSDGAVDEIRARTLMADGTLGTEQVMRTDGSSVGTDDRDPRDPTTVQIKGDAFATLFVENQYAGTQRIMIALTDETGTPYNYSEVGDRLAAEQTDPEIAPLAVVGSSSGAFVVTWVESGTIYAQVKLQNGLDYGNEILVAQVPAGTVLSSPAVIGVSFETGNNATGDVQPFLIVWVNETTGELQAQRFRSDGTRLGDVVTISNDADGLGGNITDPELAYTDDFRIAVSWNNGEVYAAMLDLRPDYLIMEGIVTTQARDGAALEASNFDDVIYGSGYEVLVYGRGGDDYFFGTDGDEDVYMGEGIDRVAPSAGNDLLDGGPGDDFLNGGEGDDTVIGGAGADSMTGGPGMDTLSYQQSFGRYGFFPTTEGVTINVQAGIISGGHAEGDVFSNFENLRGTYFDDVLTPLVFFRGAFVDGYLGNDTLDMSGINLGASASTNLETGETSYGVELRGIENYTGLAGAGTFETITGSIRANIITDSAGDSTISAGRGNDIIHAGAGNSIIDGGEGEDIMHGGAGDDVYGVDSIGDRVIELAGEGYDHIVSIVDIAAAERGFDNVEKFQITGDATSIVANDQANELVGNANLGSSLSGMGGDDILTGFKFDDILDGGEGVDTMIGGLGDDTYYIDSVFDAVIEKAGEGTDRIYTSINLNPFGDRYANVESFALTGSANALHGTKHDEELLANPALGSKLFGYGGADVLRGSVGNDRLFGGTGNDVLLGNAGNDRLDGQTGADDMRGGKGDDNYIVDDAGDTVSEFAGEGVDKVKSFVDFTLGAHVENLILVGSAAEGIGNDLDNTIFAKTSGAVLHGFGGDDLIRATQSADVIDGGDGNDSINGRGGNDTITGGNGDDELSGRGGEDIIDGGAGNDDIIGGADSDTIIGGADQDTMRGEGGADTFAFATGDFAGLTATTADRITDFDQAEGDLIDLTALDAIIGDKVDDAFTFIGDAGFSKTAGELRFEQADGNTMVYMDVDGDGAADYAIRLDGLINLTGADFIL